MAGLNEREADLIGPLGPHLPAPRTIEVGRLPIEVEGKWITEFEPDGKTVHRVYSYAKRDTGDKR